MKQDILDYQSLFFTKKEAAEFLGISEVYLYEGIKRGSIPSVRFSNKLTLIPKLEFARWYNLHWNDRPLFPPDTSRSKRVKKEIPFGEAVENLIVAIFGEDEYTREHIRSKIIQHAENVLDVR